MVEAASHEQVHGGAQVLRWTPKLREIQAFVRKGEYHLGDELQRGRDPITARTLHVIDCPNCIGDYERYYDQWVTAGKPNDVITIDQYLAQSADFEAAPMDSPHLAQFWSDVFEAIGGDDYRRRRFSELLGHNGYTIAQARRWSQQPKDQVEQYDALDPRMRGMWEQMDRAARELRQCWAFDYIAMKIGGPRRRGMWVPPNDRPPVTSQQVVPNDTPDQTDQRLSA